MEYHRLLLEHYLVHGTSFAGVLAKMCGIDDPYVFVAIVIARTRWVLHCVRLLGLLVICSFSGGGGKDN